MVVDASGDEVHILVDRVSAEYAADRYDSSTQNTCRREAATMVTHEQVIVLDRDEMLPTVRRVAVLANADSPLRKALLDHVQMAADARKIEIKATMVHAADQLDSDFADFEAWGAEALLVHLALPQKQIADLAIKHHLPSVSPSSAFCGVGGLASYSPGIEALAHQSATFVDKILKGRKPSDLPVELPTGFRLRVNLKTARAIGLSILPTLLARADEVIE
jgi:putative ABC transport system substrate-binding protein